MLPPAAPRAPGDPPDAGQLRRFLHYGHVFSSAVHEVLESRYIAETSPLPLTVPQFHLLKLIARRGAHQVGEVADYLGVSSPAVSKNIAKLEAYRLVTRSAAPGDRRVTLLSVSEEGRALVRRYEAVKAARLVPVLAAFTPEEIDAFTALLERFSVRLFQAEEASTSFCLRCAAYGDASCSLVAVDGECPFLGTDAAARAVDGAGGEG